MRRGHSVLTLGLALACAGPSELEQPRVLGRVLYEAGAPTPARSLRVTLRAGESVLASHVLVPTERGRFELPIAEDVEGPLAIEVEALFVDAGGAPLIAAGQPDGAGSHPLRSWRFEVCAGGCERVIDAGDLVIREDARAALALDVAAAALERVRSHPALAGVEPPSVLILVSDDVEPACGSCYRPLALGGGALLDEEGTTAFDAVIELRPDATDSTIAHEVAHWIMEGFSRWPNDLSIHDPAELARPGVAYTEGFATLHGQATLSWITGEDRPIARFGALEVDLASGRVNAQPVEPPLGSDSDDPWATETTVAAVLWAIRHEIGDQATVAAIASPRLFAIERDHGRVDLVDLLDAMVCEELADEAIVQAAASAHGYPWRAGERVCAP